MPNQIAPDKAKIVYNEYRDTLESLQLIAKRRRCTISDLLREAALEYVEKHADTAELQRRKDEEEKTKNRKSNKKER